jgi:hypothetical protein
VRVELRGLRDDGRVDLGDAPAALADACDGRPQQPDRVGVLEARIGVREELPDVARLRGPEHRVGHGVRQRVGVRVPREPRLVRHGVPAEHQGAPGDEAV